MRTIIAAAALAVALALPAQVVEAQDIPPNSLSALKNCLWQQTVTEAANIERLTAQGYNVVATIARICGMMSGAQVWCEKGGGSPTYCVRFVQDEAAKAVVKELKRAGRI